MGSSKVSNPKPTMESKTSQALSILKSLFRPKKKDKSKEKLTETPKTEKSKLENESEKQTKIEIKNENAVDAVLDTFKKLNLESKKKTETFQLEKEKSKATKEDEFQHFTVKKVEDERVRIGRIDSDTSADSGFLDSKDQIDVLESLSALKIDDEKKKKTTTVVVSRGPVKQKGRNHELSHPYATGQDLQARQIYEVNQHGLCGGQVVVNPPKNKQTDELSNNFDTQINSESEWALVLDYIKKDTNKPDYSLPDFNTPDTDYNLYNNNASQLPDTFEKFTSTFLNTDSNSYNDNAFHMPESFCNDLATTLLNDSTALSNNTDNVSQLPDTFDTEYQNIDSNSNTDNNVFQMPDILHHIPNFPTPPSSFGSPMSDQLYLSQTSPDYTRSPGICSISSELEKYQEINQLDELTEEKEKVARSSVSSNYSMTMKNFKDLQKDILNGFSKKECCNIKRKSCKEIFEEHLKQLDVVERKNLCLNVSKLNINSAYGVLQHVLLDLSRTSDEDHFRCSLFALTCHRVLAEKPELFVGDFGLNVLKAAVLRCGRRPALTRCVVDCVRAALRATAQADSKEPVFTEVDGLGDTLVSACARAGDGAAPALAELVCGSERPLFDLEHVNGDGQTALHVSCALHAPSAPRLHTAHVLLEHAGADLWKGDVRGGDTALHLAVNSMHCDLHLVLMIFKQLDRKEWKRLANCHNLSSVTPLEYARSASRSTTRENYPQEVLSFLKKCR